MIEKDKKRKKEKKRDLIAGEYTLKTNRGIIDELIKTGLPYECVKYQFAKLWRQDPWKLQYMNDMYQDLIVFLLTYDNDKLNNAYWNNHSNALITRILQNQLWSDHSKFYIDYCKFNRQTDDIDEVITQETNVNDEE